MLDLESKRRGDCIRGTIKLGQQGITAKLKYLALVFFDTMAQMMKSFQDTIVR